MSNHNRKGARRKGALRSVDREEARVYGFKRERIGNGTHTGWSLACSVRGDSTPPCLGRIERQWGSYEPVDRMVATMRGEGWHIDAASPPICPRCRPRRARPPGALPQATGAPRGGEGESHQEPYTSGWSNDPSISGDGSLIFPGKASDFSREKVGGFPGPGDGASKKIAEASPLQEQGLVPPGRCRVHGCQVGRTTFDGRYCICSPGREPPACLMAERHYLRKSGLDIHGGPAPGVETRVYGAGGPVDNSNVVDDAGGQGGADLGSANRGEVMSERVFDGSQVVFTATGDCADVERDSVLVQVGRCPQCGIGPCNEGPKCSILTGKRREAELAHDGADVAGPQPVLEAEIGGICGWSTMKGRCSREDCRATVHPGPEGKIVDCVLVIKPRADAKGPTMSDAELAANTLSPREGKALHWHLATYFGEDGTYAKGWDDGRIAKACGVSRETVEIVRERAYGALRPVVDPRIEALERRLAGFKGAVTAGIQELEREIATLKGGR